VEGPQRRYAHTMLRIRLGKLVSLKDNFGKVLWKRLGYLFLIGVVGLILLWVGLRFLLVRLLSGGLRLGVKNIRDLEREEGLF